MKPRIHTLTGNLLWEATFAFASWAAGRTQRAQGATYQAGGKGINVSKMLMRLGAPTTALLFPGGATGADCVARLQAQQLDCQAFPLSAPTRAGLVVRAPGQAETTFFGPDVPLEAVAAAACAAHLDAIPDGDVLAVCGSLPGWDAPAAAPLRAALERRIGRGPVVVDTYGPPLAWATGLPLAWVKVNRAEFDGLFPESQRQSPVAGRLEQAVRRWAPSAWIVTDGPRPVWFVERGGAPPQELTPPRIEEVSATGSGDVLHATLLYAIFHQRLPLGEALRRALPYAAASAAHPAIAEFDLNNLPSLGSMG